MIWICFILSLAASNQPNDDAVSGFLDSLGPAQLGVCAVEPRYRFLDPHTFVGMYLADSECGTELGVFRVLPNGGFKRLATSTTAPRRIKLRDLTGNGVPEILVTQPPGNRSASVVILRWDGVALTRIGETSDRAVYVDLDGDGVLEIVEHAAGRTFVQRLKKGRYVSTAKRRVK